MKTFNPIPGSFFLVMLFLLGGCAGLPLSPVPLGTATRVCFNQPAKKGSRSLAMQLINRAAVQGERPQHPGTKITSNQEMDNLLRCLAAADYFAVAPKAGIQSAGVCFISVDADQGNWSLTRPSIHGGQGRVPGESLVAASKRFNHCLAIFNEFFNRTFDLVPVEVRDGRRHFFNQQKSLHDRNREKSKSLEERIREKRAEKTK